MLFKTNKLPKFGDKVIVTGENCCGGFIKGTVGTVVATQTDKNCRSLPSNPGKWYFRIKTEDSISDLFHCLDCASVFGGKKIKDTKLRTQKAKGLQTIEHIDYNVGTNVETIRINANDHVFITTDKDIKKLSLTKPVFARPCPIRPRHGFVESRLCSTKKEIKLLWNEVKKIDPEAELALGRQHLITHSAVLADNSILAIGLGNAGATGGKDSISIPVLPEQRFVHKPTLKKAGLSIKDRPYYEYIYTKNNEAYCVQLRGGPKVTTTGPDFIPIETVVKTIITPTDDLLAWEKIIENAPIGTVAYAPGGTLASHAAVHCICKNVPYVTSKKPEIGEVLKAPTKIENIFNVNEFKGALGVVWKMDANELSKYLLLAVCLFHQYSAWRLSPKSSCYLGFVAGIMFRSTQMFVCGEHRHYGGKKCDRKTAWEKGLYSSVNELPIIYNHFMEKTRWGSGFGGKKWANITKLAIKTYNCFSTVENTSELVSSLNKLVNAVHNGAKLFTKAITETELDAAAKNPTVLTICLGPLLYKLLNKQFVEPPIFMQPIEFNTKDTDGEETLKKETLTKVQFRHYKNNVFKFQVRFKGKSDHSSFLKPFGVKTSKILNYLIENGQLYKSFHPDSEEEYLSLKHVSKNKWKIEDTIFTIENGSAAYVGKSKK